MNYAAKDKLLEILRNLGADITIASRRGPYRYEKNVLVPSPGGLVNVVGPIVDVLRMHEWGKTEAYDVKWMSRREDDNSVSRVDVPVDAAECDQYTWVRLRPSDLELVDYAQKLWYIRHNVRRGVDIDPGFVDRKALEKFITGNKNMGMAVVHEQSESYDPKNPPILLSQDYQLPFDSYFAVKGSNANGRDIFTMQYDHIPWPHPDNFGMVLDPKQYLSYLLEGNRIYGLQTEDDVKRFLLTVEEFLGKDAYINGNIVGLRGHETLVGAYPVSVDGRAFREDANRPEVLEAARKKREDLNVSDEAILVYSIDRGGERTKQVTRKIEVFTEFLRRHPSYYGRLFYYQVCDPSRQHLDDYRNELDLTRKAAEEANRQFPGSVNLDIDWRPRTELLPIHLAGDVLWVYSVDGQNLVAKEAGSIADIEDADFEHPTSLVLCERAGCSRQLGRTGALTFDDHNVYEMLERAVNMPKEEKSERAKSLVREILEEDIYDYGCRVFSDIHKIKTCSKWQL